MDEAEAFKQMLAEKEVGQKEAFITVFVFGERKTIEEFRKEPCDSRSILDFSWFIGKDLKNKSVYAKMIDLAKNICSEGLEFKVQIAAYRSPENYKWDHLKQYGDPLILIYPDGITRFTQGQYSTLGGADILM